MRVWGLSMLRWLKVTVVALVLVVPAAVAGLAIGGGALVGFGVFFFTLIVTIVGVGYLGFRWGRRNRVPIRTFAESRGWTYIGEGADIPLPARGFPFSAKGIHSTWGLIEGEQGGTAFAILSHSVSTRKSGNYPLVFSVAAAHVPADLPVTVARPQQGWEAFAAAVGAEDIDTESADFNEKWRVWSVDKRAAHAILHPRVMERLLEDDAGRFAIAWDSNAVMYIMKGTWNVKDIDGILDLLVDLAVHVPAYLVRERPEGVFK